MLKPLYHGERHDKLSFRLLKPGAVLSGKKDYRGDKLSPCEKGGVYIARFKAPDGFVFWAGLWSMAEWKKPMPTKELSAAIRKTGWK